MDYITGAVCKRFIFLVLDLLSCFGLLLSSFSLLVKFLGFLLYLTTKPDWKVVKFSEKVMM